MIIIFFIVSRKIKHSIRYGFFLCQNKKEKRVFYCGHFNAESVLLMFLKEMIFYCEKL
jgi:hypothetical protein